MFSFKKIQTSKSKYSEQDVQNISFKSEREREDFLKQNIKFILKHVMKTTGAYVEVENDPYFAVGLEAFYTSIESYEPNKGSFYAYASRLIRNKVIDEMRKADKHENQVISLNAYIDHTGKEPVSYQNIEREHERLEDIRILREKLHLHKISFETLADSAPKHSVTRANCYRIADINSRDDIIKDGIWMKGLFLRKRIAQLARVTEKVLKRNRKFIIASSIICIGQLETLMEYIDYSGGDDLV